MLIFKFCQWHNTSCFNQDYSAHWRADTFPHKIIHKQKLNVKWSVNITPLGYSILQVPIQLRKLPETLLERSKISCNYDSTSTRVQRREETCLGNKEKHSTCRVIPRAPLTRSEHMFLIWLWRILYWFKRMSVSVNRLSNSICTGINAPASSLWICKSTIWLIVKAPLTNVHFPHN